MLAFAVGGICSIEFTRDLRCSACVVTTRVVEDAILQYLQDQDVRTTNAGAASAATAAACAKIPRVAIAGKDGRREFIDFNKAMRQEQRGSKDMDLVNVKFTRDATTDLRSFCATAARVRTYVCVNR